MPKLEITEIEKHQLLEALNTEIKSCNRAQNSGKSPKIKEVYALQQRELQSLYHKVDGAK